MSTPFLEATINYDLFNRAIDKWGVDMQVMLAIEEFSEVVDILSQRQLGDGDRTDLRCDSLSLEPLFRS